MSTDTRPADRRIIEEASKRGADDYCMDLLLAVIQENGYTVLPSNPAPAVEALRARFLAAAANWRNTATEFKAERRVSSIFGEQGIPSHVLASLRAQVWTAAAAQLDSVAALPAQREPASADARHATPVLDVELRGRIVGIVRSAFGHGTHATHALDEILEAIAAAYAQAGDAAAEAAMRRMVERAQASGTYDEYRPTATREHGDAVEAEREEQGR